ncbi:MAG: hypothetical protein PHO57_10280 [Acidithiobacillus sp.]|nr:hypothetical protein [Acidithiobacillus sp.]
MPTPASIDPFQLLANAVHVDVSAFMSSGGVALSAIGTALLGVAGLFVLFFLVAASFGWRIRPPKRFRRSQGIVGNPNKFHFERTGSRFNWSRFIHPFDRVYNASFDDPISGPSSPVGGFGHFVSGHEGLFGPEVPSGWSTDDLYDYDDLDMEDGRDGFYADVSYLAPVTSDGGPGDIPGSQNGGGSGRYVGRAVVYGQFLSDVFTHVFGDLAHHRDDDGYAIGCVNSASFCNYPGVFSWDFADETGSTGAVHPLDVMAFAKDRFAAAFGRSIDLGNYDDPESARLTYHALRVSELHAMRSLGWVGSHEDFRASLAESGFRNIDSAFDDSDVFDAEFDAGAYDR